MHTRIYICVIFYLLRDHQFSSTPAEEENSALAICQIHHIKKYEKNVKRHKCINPKCLFPSLKLPWRTLHFHITLFSLCFVRKSTKFLSKCLRQYSKLCTNLSFTNFVLQRGSSIVDRFFWKFCEKISQQASFPLSIQILITISYVFSVIS